MGRPDRLRELDVFDPSTEQSTGTIAIGSAADAERAIEAARAAFTTYSQTPKGELPALLERILAILKRRRHEIGDIILP
ncbi:hypothetical protein A6U98_16640 [Rhizobium sp. WYCCWR10014]|nr:hypothetical protein A6U98_16640 [Rhizobium sp. WYCCWR10014]